MREINYFCIKINAMDVPFVNLHTHHPAGEALTLCSAGIHPWWLDDPGYDWEQALEALERQLREGTLEAIGEAGLDKMHPDISFWSSFLTILGKVFPLLIAPFVLAVLTRWLWPKANAAINRHKNLSFYIWAVSLTVVISRAIEQLVDQFYEHRNMFLWMVALSIFLCFLQFFVGHRIGKRYGDYVAGGQSLGQKNTVLAIWMSQTFLLDLSCIVPTLYVLWQNLYNSFQMMQKERRDNHAKEVQTP